MSCNLNLRAPNGKLSKLFTDIAETVPESSEAIDLYYYTRTDTFKDAYMGARDSNGEPIYSEFSDAAYLDDVDYNKVEMDSAAEVYKELMEELPNLLSIVDERVHYLDNNKTDKNAKYLEDLKNLKKDLEEKPINVSLKRFIKTAVKHTAGLRKAARKALKDPSTDIKEMASYFKISQSYAIISELSSTLSENPEIQKMFAEELYTMSNTISYIADIKGAYISKSIDFLAEEFSKRDTTWSKKAVRQALLNAPRDTSFLEMTLEYMGDSQDKVISMMAQVLKEADHKTRRNGLDFSVRLQEKLEAIEKKYPGKKGSEIFEGLIVESSNGEIHVIDHQAQDTGGINPLMDQMAAKLAKVSGDQELMEFLHFYNTEMQSLNAMLPQSSQIGTRAPSVLRSDFELVEGVNIKERYGLLTDAVKKKFQKSNMDMDYGKLTDAAGKPLQRIPTFYTQKYNSIDFDNYYTKFLDENLEAGMTSVDAAENAANRATVQATKDMAKYVSRDLAGSLQQFHAMTTNYSNKNEIVDIMDSGMAIVGSKRRKYTQIDSSGIPLLRRDGRRIVESGEESRTAEYLAEVLNTQLYGQKEKDLGYVEIFGAKVDWNKGLRAINNYTGLVQMGVSVMAAMGNVTMGEFQTFQEAVAGEFFTVEDLAKATGEYKADIFNILGDIGQRTPTSKTNLLEEHYNILQSYGGDKMTATERSTARRLMKTSSVYFLSTAGEHGMQVRGGLAMLNKEIAYNKDGSVRGTLLAQHTKVDGKLHIPTDIYVKDEAGVLQLYDTNQQNRMSNRIGAVMRQIHGNYSEGTANYTQKDARLSMVAKFRGWMYEGFARRFRKSKDNHILNQKQEGYYRTGGKAAMVLFNDMKKMQLSLTRENWANMTPHEKANVKRLVVEATMIATTAAASALLGHAGKMIEDEYDGDNFQDRLVLGSYHMLVYQVNRLYTEMRAYTSVVESMRLARSPAAAISMLEGTSRLLAQVAENPSQEYDQGWRKGQNKALVMVEKLTPIYKQIATLNADGIQDRGQWLTK